MKKKFICVFLAVVMTATLLAGCGNNNSGSSGGSSSSHTETENVETVDSSTSSVLKDGEKTVLTIVFPGSSSSPASLTKVEKAITEIVNETIDCEVDLQIIEWGVYKEQTNLMLSSGESIDAVLTIGTVAAAANSGQIMDISDMIGIYAPETIELMGNYITGCYMGDELYGLPSYRDFASASGLVCRTDILEELSVDPDTIKSWEDVNTLLGQVKEAYPDLDVLVPANLQAGMLYMMMNGYFDQLYSEIAGVYYDGRDGLTAHSIYESDEFMEVAKQAYDWNQKGYFIADSTTLTETRQAFLSAGSCFGYIGTIHPGTKTQESINAGVDVTTIQINKQGSGTSNIANIQYSIPSASDAPEKALALLNLIYSNPDIQNLLHWGIEGEDYVLVADSVAGYPDGVNSDNTGWSNETWLTGNATIGYAWETDVEDVWTKYEEFNNNANFSPALGFSFDSSSVKNEITAVSNVRDKYKALIYSGLSDPEETVAAFNKELQTAGIQKIVDEMQAQLDAWSQSNQ